MRPARHLAVRSGKLFGARYELLLYDLSTYVEGAAAANPQMRRGYSPRPPSRL